ncbi:MAG: putative PPIC-type PPIASE domain protein [Parcubacteria group bacterium Gr01-1014_31]|nr:MAG: putative PPIC-type PPIASE domain protein [Parcubacteria group bacterium Gr01-1014_31]
MPDLSSNGKTFSENELSAMRREVLAWIERDRQRPKIVAGKPAPSAVKASVPKRPTRPKKKTTTTAAAAAAPPQKSVPRALKLIIPRLPLALPPGRARRATRPPRRPAQTAKRRRRTPLLAVSIFAALVTMLFAVVLVGAYRFGWSNWAVAALARVLPLPAVDADGRVYWLDDYLRDVEMLRRSSVRTGRPQGDGELRRQAFTRFVGQAAIDRLAEQYQVQVGAAAVNAQLQQLIAQSGSRERLEQSVRENFYGWSLDDFSERLVRPYLLELAVRAKLWEDPQAWEAAAVRLKSIHQSLAEGASSFAATASEVNRDDSRAIGGDLGYRGRDDLDVQIFAAAEKISDGEVSPPMRTAQGYVLLLREESVGEGSDLRLRLRVITVTPVDYFEQRLGEILRSMNIHRYAP